MRSLRRCGWLAGFGTATLLAAVFGATSPAGAAFPGRNGLLAVQPLRGSGVVLVKANGRGERLLCQPGSACANGCFWAFACARSSCPPGTACASPLRPAWSPNGRALALFGKTPSPSSVVYADGSCLVCDGLKLGLFGSPEPGPGEAAFMSDPTVLTAVWSGGSSPSLIEFGVDELPKKVLLSGPLSDPAWSSRGELAVVRSGWIWVGSPGRLRRLTRGSAPSWSPDGKQIALQRGGWVLVGSVRRHLFRRLVQGSAPVWSPDGRWIAFFGKSHRLNVIPAGGGRVRHVGGVTGSTVDWQPLPAKPPVPCLTPPGSSVLANSSSAIVSVDYLGGYFLPPYVTSAVMGCLRADGRERLLTSYTGTNPEQSNATVAAATGNYAALITHSVAANRYTASAYASDAVRVFDLRTGTGDARSDRGGEQISCFDSLGPSPSPPCETTMDSLVVGSDAVSAAHSTVRDKGCTCTVEQIQASDSTGVRTLDSVTETDGSPPALTNLTLTGDRLSWEHNGSPRSAQLAP